MELVPKYTVEVNKASCKTGTVNCTLRREKKLKDLLTLQVYFCTFWTLNPVNMLTKQKVKLTYTRNNFTFKSSSYTKVTSVAPDYFHSSPKSLCTLGGCHLSHRNVCSFGDIALPLWHKNYHRTHSFEAYKKSKTSNPWLCLHIAHLSEYSAEL